MATKYVRATLALLFKMRKSHLQMWYRFERILLQSKFCMVNVLVVYWYKTWLKNDVAFTTLYPTHQSYNLFAYITMITPHSYRMFHKWYTFVLLSIILPSQNIMLSPLSCSKKDDPLHSLKTEAISNIDKRDSYLNFNEPQSNKIVITIVNKHSQLSTTFASFIHG